MDTEIAGIKRRGDWEEGGKNLHQKTTDNRKSLNAAEVDQVNLTLPEDENVQVGFGFICMCV